MNILTGLVIVVCLIHAIWHLIKLLFMSPSDSSSFYDHLADTDYRVMNFLSAIFYGILVFILVMSLS